MPLQVEIVAADRSVWKGEAQAVTARTTEGEIGILAQHQPIIASLVPGPVSVTSGGSTQHYEIDGGFLSVQSDTVSIVAETVTESDGRRSVDAH